MRSLFFVNQITDPILIDGDEGHHAADVIRVKVGEEIDVSDNSRFVHARITSVAKGRVEAEILADLQIPKMRPAVTVAQALIKGDALYDSVDLMVQVGIDRIIPWTAERSIVQWDSNKAEKNLAKLQSVAFEASKQARRPQRPRVDGVLTATALKSELSSFDRVVLLHESGSEYLADDSFDCETILLVVGPEGGFSEKELEFFGVDIRRLGPTVIRSAQAGAVAAAVVFAASSWRS